MNWTNVKEKHFADIEVTENGYTWESDMIEEPFMVALETNKGWCMQQVVLIDEIGLQCYTDDDGYTYFGWEITDVTHWCKLTPPKD